MGSEMCIRDRTGTPPPAPPSPSWICLLVIRSGPLCRIHRDRCPDHRDMTSTNHWLDGGIGVVWSYDRKRAQKRSPGVRCLWGGWVRLGAATSAFRFIFAANGRLWLLQAANVRLCLLPTLRLLCAAAGRRGGARALAASGRHLLLKLRAPPWSRC